MTMERPDLKAMQIRHEISSFLRHLLADDGKVEGGGGGGQEDIWFAVDGVKFHITIDWPKPALSGKGES
jgi:hypothetical protein